MAFFIINVDIEEEQAIYRAASRHSMARSDWLAHVIRAALRHESASDVAAKLAALRAATVHTFPTADIDQMLTEIASGRS